MKELVGQCVKCKKELFCLDGFFQAEISSGELYCYDCFDQTKKEGSGESQ